MGMFAHVTEVDTTFTIYQQGLMWRLLNGELAAAESVVIASERRKQLLVNVLGTWPAPPGNALGPLFATPPPVPPAPNALDFYCRRP